jgi:nucleotidyltransferase/DNA polymerase involved in DNA repair
VADITGVSLSTVKRIADEPPIRDLDDAAERKRRGIGRPSTVEKHRRKIERLLDRDPWITSAEVVRRLRRAGYRGGISAVYALVAELRD